MKTNTEAEKTKDKKSEEKIKDQTRTLLTGLKEQGTIELREAYG